MKQNYLLLALLLFFLTKTSAKATDFIEPPVVTVNDNSVCTGTQVTLTATGTGIITWYTTANGSGTSVGTGTTLNITPEATTTYYAKATSTGTPVETAMSTGITVTVNQIPTVSFSFDNNNTCSGTVIHFTSNPANGSGPFTYAWDFGDGSTATTANPTHSFNALGCGTQTYTVTLTVTSNGCESNTATQTVTVKQKPNINFTDTANPFDPFNNCGFASSSDPAYTITVGNISESSCVTSYSINWGDGQSQSNISFPISHTYTTLNAFSMVITAIGTNGCSNSKTYIIKNVTNPSGGIISPGNTTNLCAPTIPLAFAISSWATNSPGTTYSVDYGDGMPPLLLTQEQMIASSYYNITNPADSPNYPVPYIYTTSTCLQGGTISVLLTVTNACGTTPGTVSNISVLVKPQADFTHANVACTNTPVTFVNTTLNGYNQGCSQNFMYEWNFGDGTVVTTPTPIPLGQQISHTFLNPGTYDVTLKATGYCGNSTITKQICIENPLSAASFTLNNTTGCGSVAAQATNTTLTTGSCNVSYNWNVTYISSFCGTNPGSSFNYFTNGSSATSPNPSFNFPNPGTYTVKLIATNSCGSVETNQTVTVKAPPTVTINNIPNICGGSAGIINPTATVTNCAGSGSAISYAWSFPGGSPATFTGQTPPAISYATAGTYTVTLAVTNDCGTTTATEEFTVSAVPVMTALTNQTRCAGEQTTAVAFSSDLANTTYNWTNSNTAIGLLPSGAGTSIPAFTTTNITGSPITATITVTPTTGGCAGTPQTFTITVNPVPVVSTPANLSICNGAQQNAIPLTTAATGTAISWTNSNPSIGLAATGTGNIPLFTATNTGTQAVTATITITATSNGCPGPETTFTITVNPTPAPLSVDDVALCNGVESEEIVFTNAVAGTTYNWTNSNTAIGLAASGSGNIPMFMPANTTSAAITATITVTPALGSCTGVAETFTITVSPSPVVIFSQANQTICSGGTTTAVTLTSPTSGVAFTWQTTEPVGTEGVETSGTATIPVQTVTNNTDAPITITYNAEAALSGGSACEGATFPYTITVNPKPNVDAMEGEACSGSAFSITPQNTDNGVVPTGTQYSWAAPAAIPGISGLAAGSNQTSINGTLSNTTTQPVAVTYIVTPTANNCAGNSFNVVVTIAPTPTVTVNGGNQTVCNGAATTAITFTGTINGTTFSWVNSNPAIGLEANGTGTIDVFNAINSTPNAITATITVTPQLNGCNGTPQTFTITVNPAPGVTPSIDNQTICSGTTSAAVTLTSTTTGAAISWTATQPAGLSGVTTSGTNTIPAQTLVNTTGSPITVTYTAVAETTTGTSGCPGAPLQYTITVTPVPFADGVQQATTCSGTSPDFIPANTGTTNMPAGVTFTWAAPTGTGFTDGLAQNTPQTSLNQVLVNTTANPVVATYTVTPQFGGCTGVSFTVAVTVNPTATVPNATLTLCSGTAFEFNPETTATLFPAGTVFNWAAPTGNVTGGEAGSAQATVTGMLTNNSSSAQAVVYTVTPVSPQGNCNGAPFTLTVTVNPQFTLTPTVSNYNGFSISSAGADDAFINLATTGGTGSYTYSWTGPDGFTATTQNVTNLGPGTYTVVVSDGLCANFTQNFTITEPMPLVIAEVIAGHVNVDCFGQSTGALEVEITQESIAPYDYALLLPDGTVVANALDQTATGHVFSNLAANTYTIRVTDANGTIKYINNVVVTQPASGVTVTGTASDFNGFSISCNGANNGSIGLTVTGGYPGYTYSWTGPDGFTATTEDIANLSPGTYTVTVNDTTNSCPVIQTYTITQPQPVAFTGTVPVFNGFEVSCFGGNNGSINITPTGGTGVFTYSWSGPDGFTATTQNLANLVVGTYTVTIADNNGCTAPSQSFTLTQPTALYITETHVNVLCFGAATGAIDVTVTGGIPDADGLYSYAWTGPNGFTATQEDLANIPAGIYNLVATDNNGCTIPLSVTLTQQPEIIITPTTTAITCYGANNASISLAISGGDAPYTATWSNLATGTYQDNLSAGTYTITVTDESNCVKVITVVIPEAPVFTVNPVFNHISCHGANDGSIALNLVGGIAPVTLVWSDGSNQGTTRNNLGPGTYTATITDGTPCEIIRTFTIVEPAALTIGANITHALDCNDPQSGAINLVVAGGTLPYTFAWSNGDSTEDLTGLTSGTYSVTVTDAAGCTATGTYSITRPEPVVLNVTNSLAVNCNTHTVVQTNIAQAAGGVPPFQYTWSAGNVSGNFGQFMNTNQNGTIIVTATDSQGCTATTTFEVETEQLGEADFTAGSYAFTTYREYSVFDPVTFENLSTGDYSEVGWNFGDGATSNEVNPSHTYVREGTYTVTLHVVYPYGCSDTYTMTLVVTKGYNIMVPNAFTPNSDSMNETFNAVHKGLKSIELNVYTTWGELVYSEKGETLSGWNGYIKNNPSENGNYYYRINAETFYGQFVELSGPFVLIK